MICTKPYVQGLHAFPCGQCDPCLISRKKVWSHRIYLESLKHAYNSFLTLTYDPERFDDTNLNPLHLQLFFKRLRKALAPLKIRYFAVGEYGDQNCRAHYHAALFGVDFNDPVVLDIVRTAWGMGHVMLAELNPSTAKYIAGYLNKKMLGNKDPRLEGRVPEFTRMSNRPGIGALAMVDVAASLLEVENGRYVALQEDVPTSLMMGSKPFPLGRYLRRKLREELGLPPGAPPELLNRWTEEMRSMLTDAFGPASHANPWSRERIRNFLVRESAGKVANMAARFKYFEPKRSL